MDNKCFETKYQRVVNNDNLPHVGEVKFKAINDGGISIVNSSGSKVHIVTDNNINVKLNNDLNTTTTREFVISDNDWCNISIQKDTTLKVYPRYTIKNILNNSPINASKATLYLDIDQLSYMANLTELNILGLNSNIYGNIESLRTSTNLTRLILSSNNVSGDISALSNMTQLTNLNLDFCNITGDISALSNMTQLTNLSLGTTNITGDISALSNMTQLTNLSLYKSTNITGSISVLSSLNTLVNVNLSNCNKLTGDISSIMNLPNIKTIYLPNTITHTDEQIQTLTNRGVNVVFTN